MNVRDYIEHLKGKSEPTRRRIALGAAAGATLVVGLAWMTTLLSSGVLALDEEPRGDGFSVAARQMDQDLSGLAGAAAALEFDASNTGEVTVVESKASSTLDRSDTGEATVIPF